MNVLYAAAKRLQFLDQLLPLAWRVPARYHALRMSGGIEQEVALLPTLVPENSIAVDVGANQGTYSYRLAGLARSVIAIEPIPFCAATIDAWAKGRNVAVHCCGVSDVHGVLTLHVPTANGRPISTRASFVRSGSDDLDLAVPVVTLDSFDMADVGFIKIDVEGHELSVLKGAEATISRYRPTLLVEIDPIVQPPTQFAAVFNWLSERGYSSYHMSNNGLVPCDTSVQTERPEVYNFIFIHTTNSQG